MAIFILLLKEYENEEVVVYKFGPNEKTMGKIQLNKKTEIISELESLSSQKQDSDFYFRGAAIRLARCFERDKGTFPEKMTYQC